MKMKISELKAEDFVQTGLRVEDAEALAKAVQVVVSVLDSRPDEVWCEVVARRLLRPHHPHALHQLIYYTVYSPCAWDSSLRGPPLYWFPSPYESRYTNLGHLMEAHGPRLLGNSYTDPITSFSLFRKFSTQNPEIYWPIVLKELSLRFHQAPKCILNDTNKSKPGGTWFPGSVLNISECCLLPTSHPRKMDHNFEIVWREEGSDDSPVNQLTLKELREQVMLVANALDCTFSKGDVIAIDMPMTVSAVIKYLAIILLGRIVTTIADSFAAKEIAARLRVSQAKAVFTQSCCGSCPMRSYCASSRWTSCECSIEETRHFMERFSGTDFQANKPKVVPSSVPTRRFHDPHTLLIWDYWRSQGYTMDSYISNSSCC